MEPTGHCACLSAGRKGCAAAGRTTARSKASVATALMATGKAIDVDRRAFPLLLCRCFFPQTHATPWGIKNAAPRRVESGLAHEDQDACCASFACAAGSPIQAASKLLTQPREVRRHGQHSVAPGGKFREYWLWSQRAGSMNQNRDGSRQRRTPMKWMLTMLAAGTCAGAFIALAAPVQAADMSLTRLDCGTPQAPVAVNQRFSDIYAYGGLKLQFVYSCYLVKHGDDYLLWDTGHAMTTPNVAPKVSIVDQLEKIGVKVEDVKYVGISHYHGDH